MMVAKMETSWKTQSFAKMEVGNYFLHTLWKNVYTSINLFLAEKKWIFLSLHFLANCKSAKKLQKSLLRLSIPVKTIYLSLKVWVFADFWCPKWYSLKKSHFQHCKVIWIFAQNMASEFCPFWRENSKIWNVGFIIALKLFQFSRQIQHQNFVHFGAKIQISEM